VPSSAIGSVLESMPGSVHENVLGGVLGSVLECTWERLEILLGNVSQARWGCTIECSQECTSERTWEHA